MDSLGGLGLGGITKNARKRRSHLNRRPINEQESPYEDRDSISLSSTPSDRATDDVRETITETPQAGVMDAQVVQKSSDEKELLGEKLNENVTGEMVIGSCHSEGIASENKVRKVKLKVGGVTRTIHARSTSECSSVAGTSATTIHSDAVGPSRKLSRKENKDLMGEKGGLRGVPWKDFFGTGFSFGKVDIPKVDTPEGSVKQVLKPGKSYRNKSIVKKPPISELDDEEDDDEIRYLQKLKSSRITSYNDIGYENEPRVKKLRKISNVMDINSQETKKSRSVRELEDTDYLEDEASVSDNEIEPKSSKQRRESIDASIFSKRESSITTRRRAIQTGRENSPSLGASLIQFPDGLPPVPPRKQKEQLSEVEQQMKRTEAAQRRKMQNEKAARESEAEAIRKILGQDSSRKRREDKIKKRQEELAQERSANAGIVAPDVVRWIMGPSGTVVTFPSELGLPCIFDSKPCSYPPPREKCAGPSCTNAYKYRDSKSNLPLCSLLCYKAIHKKNQSLTAC